MFINYSILYTQFFRYFLVMMLHYFLFIHLVHRKKFPKFSISVHKQDYNRVINQNVKNKMKVKMLTKFYSFFIVRFHAFSSLLIVFHCVSIFTLSTSA